MGRPDKDYDAVRGASVAVKGAAKQLRQRQTNAEVVLWNALRNRQLNGLKFRRQYPVGKFVLDFFCRSCNLVIEVDGGIHDELQERDEERTRVLERYGYHVLRVTNEEVPGNLEDVINRIPTAAANRTLKSTPLPAGTRLRVERGAGVRAKPLKSIEYSCYNQIVAMRILPSTPMISKIN